MLRRLKTWLRSTMAEDRLTGLALLASCTDITVTLDAVLDIFFRGEGRGKRRGGRIWGFSPPPRENKPLSSANLSATDCRGETAIASRQFISDWYMLHHQLLNKNNNILKIFIYLQMRHIYTRITSVTYFTAVDVFNGDLTEENVDVIANFVHRNEVWFYKQQSVRLLRSTHWLGILQATCLRLRITHWLGILQATCLRLRITLWLGILQSTV